MKYTEKIVTLKNGLACTLRSPGTEDAAALLAHLKIISEQSPFVTRYADEVTMSVQEEAEFIASILSDPKQVLISGFIDGELMANLHLNQIAPREKFSHRADLGISIIEKYCGLGLGTVLREAAIDTARSAGLEQLELEVATKNARAVALYKKLGFQIYGTQPNTFKNRDGSYNDFYLMYFKL